MTASREHQTSIKTFIKYFPTESFLMCTCVEYQALIKVRYYSCRY